MDEELKKLIVQFKAHLNAYRYDRGSLLGNWCAVRALMCANDIVYLLERCENADKNSAYRIMAGDDLQTKRAECKTDPH